MPANYPLDNFISHSGIRYVQNKYDTYKTNILEICWVCFNSLCMFEIPIFQIFKWNFDVNKQNVVQFISSILMDVNLKKNDYINLFYSVATVPRTNHGCLLREITTTEMFNSRLFFLTEWVSRGPFLLGPVFFLTTLPWSGDFHLESGGIPHDAVWINSKKTQLLKIKA